MDSKLWILNCGLWILSAQKLIFNNDYTIFPAILNVDVDAKYNFF
jgi:hypothetical protein